LELYDHFSDSATMAPRLRPVRRRQHGTTKRIADVAECVLRECGRPLVRRALVERIEAKGLEIPAADKARYAGTIMWRCRHDRFVNLPGHGFWLKGEPYPPAHYSPPASAIEAGTAECCALGAKRESAAPQGGETPG
jgi:hypothetical protein